MTAWGNEQFKPSAGKCERLLGGEGEDFGKRDVSLDTSTGMCGRRVKVRLYAHLDQGRSHIWSWRKADSPLCSCPSAGRAELWSTAVNISERPSGNRGPRVSSEPLGWHAEALDFEAH